MEWEETGPNFYKPHNRALEKQQTYLIFKTESSTSTCLSRNAGFCMG